MAVSSTSFSKENPSPKRFINSNQAAVGSSYDLDQMAKDLVAWSEKDTSLFLLQFCRDKKTHPQRVSEWEKNSPTFAEALRIAKVNICCRQYEKLHDKSNPLNYGLFMRLLAMNDSFVYAYEDREKDKDAQRSKAIQESKDDSAAQASAKAVFSLIEDCKRPSKDRKTVDTNISEDAQS